MECIDDFCRTGESHGHVPYPEPGGLLEWGDSVEGDLFLWRTDDAGPAAWTVVVAGRNDDRLEYPGGLTDYLAGLVTGEVPPDGLPRPDPGHRVRRVNARKAVCGANRV